MLDVLSPCCNIIAELHVLVCLFSVHQVDCRILGVLEDWKSSANNIVFVIFFISSFRESEEALNSFNWFSFFALSCRMRSIIDHFKGSRDFPRLRIGTFPRVPAPKVLPKYFIHYFCNSIGKISL